MCDRERERERQKDRAMSRVRVVLLHLDLGIGGAERLVVNVALALLALGHEVTILTTHHDVAHCFEETRGDGPLAGLVTVVGDWLPRQIFGYGTALCSHLRMIYATLWCILQPNIPALVLLDGVSTPVPLFLGARIPTIFYCHYPDLLLCSSSRSSMLGRCYRFVLDTAEEWTTACATSILVNSIFTRETFRRTFPDLAHIPTVLYPTLEEEQHCDQVISATNRQLPDYLIPRVATAESVNLFVSLNRYERKKRIELALQAFSLLKKDSPTGKRKNLLVIAGGFDERVLENVQYLGELQAVATAIGLRWQGGADSNAAAVGLNHDTDVIFRVSISASERESLLAYTSALLYTPENEHFGIVPLEAMRAGAPVIAVNNGGPVETILHGKTGYLCVQTPDSFASAMKLLATTEEEEEADEDARVSYIVKSKASLAMGKAGQAHVSEHFTAKAMQDGLNLCISNTLACKISRLQKVYGLKCLAVVVAFIASLFSILVCFFCSIL